MELRAHLPSDCPPTSAETSLGKVYRFIYIDHDIPLAKDFLSWREINPDKPCPATLTECQVCGVSVLKSINDARSAHRKVPALRKKKLALGNLTPDLGRIQNTPATGTGKSHHTWWLCKKAEPWTVFKIVNVSDETLP